jgi:hypothetical protein
MLWRRMMDVLHKRSGTAPPILLGEFSRVSPAQIGRACLMREDLRTSAGRRTKRAKWASEAFAVHVLDVPAAVAPDAPANLHIAGRCDEAVASGLEPLQRDC